MHKRISDEEKRLRSINAYVVLFVFFIMVSAGIICVMIYNILNAFGLMKHIEVLPPDSLHPTGSVTAERICEAPRQERTLSYL